MSVCGQSGQTEDDSASEEVGAPIRDKPDTYKQKPASKVVRVLTVLAYLLSVSLAAILLSVYYVCVWKSPELPLSSTVEPSAQRALPGLADHSHLITGGGNTSVNGSTILPTPETITAGVTNGNVTSTTTETSPTTPDLPQTSPQAKFNRTSDDIGIFNDTDSIT